MTHNEASSDLQHCDIGEQLKDFNQIVTDNDEKKD
jgi:hypothetical protein